MILLTIPLLLVTLLSSDVEGVIVNTTQGQLSGEPLLTVTGTQYYSFKGIPYAQPPVGELRFLGPREPKPWTGIRNASEHGPVCPQIVPFKGTPTGSEDCLYLNVYTPTVVPDKPLPVMVYIHGGGFQRGSGNSDRYGPDYLMSHKVVLVTINYRIGLLGFLSLNLTQFPGNAGMKDQVAALQWVQKNIANFGGNPDDVTIFGQSSGGESVTLHAVSPKSKGLFKKGIAMSGVFLNDWATPFQSRRRALRLGQQLGFYTQNDQELLTFFKSLPAESFLGIEPAILRSEDPKTVLKQLTYSPVVESGNGTKNFLTSSPGLALRQGKVNDVDLIVGRTAEESLLFYVYFSDTIKGLFANYSEMLVPRKILQKITPAKMFGVADKIRAKYFGDKPIDDNVANITLKYASAAYYNFAIAKFAELFSKLGNTYFYQFSKVTNFTREFSIKNKLGLNGATHSDDLLYLFYPQDGSVTLNKDSDDFKLVNTTCTLLTNFARCGNPTPDDSLGVEWLPYESDTQYYLDINDNLDLGQHLDADTIPFWDSIYEDVKIDV